MIQVGISAQEIREVFPELVTTSFSDYYSVDYASLATVVAIGGLNEARVRIEKLEEQVSNLNKLIA